MTNDLLSKMSFTVTTIIIIIIIITITITITIIMILMMSWYLQDIIKYHQRILCNGQDANGDLDPLSKISAVSGAELVQSWHRGEDRWLGWPPKVGCSPRNTEIEDILWKENFKLVWKMEKHWETHWFGMLYQHRLWIWSEMIYVREHLCIWSEKTKRGLARMVIQSEIYQAGRRYIDGYVSAIRPLGILGNCIRISNYRRCLDGGLEHFYFSIYWE